MKHEDLECILELIGSAAEWPKFTLSVVSHGQGELIRPLLEDLRQAVPDDFELIVTLNIPEDESFLKVAPGHTSVNRNLRPKGFGANHNAAFEQSSGDLFVVVNPDIRIECAPWAALLEVIARPKVGAAGPIVLSPVHAVEDNARRFPTVRTLFRRVLTGVREPDYQADSDAIPVDWLAGMFVVFRREAFASVRGFDERYFMYFEDADICRRLRRSGWKTMLQPRASVIHDAQRASGKDRKHLQWHLASAFRFLLLSR